MSFEPKRSSFRSELFRIRDSGRHVACKKMRGSQPTNTYAADAYTHIMYYCRGGDYDRFQTLAAPKQVCFNSTLAQFGPRGESCSSRRLGALAMTIVDTRPRCAVCPTPGTHRFPVDPSLLELTTSKYAVSVPYPRLQTTAVAASKQTTYALARCARRCTNSATFFLEAERGAPAMVMRHHNFDGDATLPAARLPVLLRALHGHLHTSALLREHHAAPRMARWLPSI